MCALAAALVILLAPIPVQAYMEYGKLQAQPGDNCYHKFYYPCINSNVGSRDTIPLAYDCSQPNPPSSCDTYSQQTRYSNVDYNYGPAYWGGGGMICTQSSCESYQNRNIDGWNAGIAQAQYDDIIGNSFDNSCYGHTAPYTNGYYAGYIAQWLTDHPPYPGYVNPGFQGNWGSLTCSIINSPGASCQQSSDQSTG